MPTLPPVFLLVFLMFVSSSPAQEVWVVPDEARAVENPVALTDNALAAGEKAYGARCASCHGDLGKGDGRATRFIKPAPADFSTVEARDRMTDGEIFFKITEGKKPMPGMARTLSDEERWQVVHYVRTLQPPR